MFESESAAKKTPYGHRVVATTVIVCRRRSARDMAPSDEPKFAGTVHFIEETREYGERGFRKRLVVLETEGARFSSYVPFELIQSNCELADDLEVGDEVEITYRLSGRKWQRDEQSEVKYFLSAEALALEVLSKKSEQPDDDPPPVDEDDSVPF